MVWLFAFSRPILHLTLSLLHLCYCQLDTHTTTGTDEANSTALSPLSEVCFNGACYYLYRLDTDFHEADLKCQENSQQLAKVMSRFMERNLARKLLEEVGNGDSLAWTGLSFNLSTDKSTFYWPSDNGVGARAVDSDRVNLRDEGGSCLVVNRKDQLWQVRCTTTLMFICQTLQEPHENMSCTLFKREVGSIWVCGVNQRVGWVEAAQYCGRYNGSLLVILTNTIHQQIKEILLEKIDTNAAHFWTAASHLKVLWKKGNTSINPFSLQWDPLRHYLNIDDAVSKSYTQLYVKLGKDGLRAAYRFDRSEYFFCSEDTTGWSNNTVEIGITTTSESFRNFIDNAKAENFTSDPTALFTSAPHEHELAGVKENGMTYKGMLIIAYVLAGLFVIGLIIAIVVFTMRRRKRRKNFKVLNPETATVGNGTLGRQRNTDPTIEWEKVVSANGEDEPILGDTYKRSIDIIHNVPLDPRSHDTTPIKSSSETDFVTLKTKSPGSTHSSTLSSDIVTFTAPDPNWSLRHTSYSSLSSNRGPPIPPKSAALLNYDVTTGAINHDHHSDAAFAMDDLAELPPPPEELLKDNRPPVPPKPAKKPPRRHKKKSPKCPPELIYAKVDKSRISRVDPSEEFPPPPPELVTRPASNGKFSPASDNADSGIDDNVHSPRLKPFREDDRTPTDEIAFLDSVLAGLS